MTTLIKETIIKTTITVESTSKIQTIVLCNDLKKWGEGFLAVHFNGTIDSYDEIYTQDYNSNEKYFLKCKGTRRTRSGMTGKTRLIDLERIRMSDDPIED